MEAVIYHRRWVSAALQGARSANKVRLLFGARQTGKTALLQQLLPRNHTIVFNLQEARLRRQFESDPASFRREILALPPAVSHVAVDEIQKAPALLEEIQALYDSHPRRCQFFLTGSSARKLRTHSANLLPGRCHLYHLLPTVRGEEPGWCSALTGEKSLAAAGFPARSLEQRLSFGSLPGVQLEAPATAAATLEAYVDNYLEEEIRREGLVRNVGPFQIFLQLAALESGRQVNLARLSQESGVPASTLKLYYQLAVDTFVGYWVPAYGPAGRKRLLTTPRFLMFDLGVRNAAAGLPLTAPLVPELGGALLEHWVGLELLHRASYIGRSATVTFWRTVSGAEVDYIWQVPDEHVPVEVKWTTHPQPADARHVEAFLKAYPKKARRGFVVCRVERAQQLTEHVTAIPWQEL